MTLAVVARTPITEDLSRVVLRRSGTGDLPRWRPGDTVGLVERPGRITSFPLFWDPESPDGPEHWSVLVHRVDDLRGGSAQRPSLRVGDSVSARGPQSLFHLVEAPIHVFVADRTGLVNLAPMFTHLEARGDLWRLHLTEPIGSLSAVLPASRGDLALEERAAGADRDGPRIRWNLPSIDELPDRSAVYVCADRATLDHVLHRTTSRPVPGELKLQCAESTFLGPCPVLDHEADEGRCTITAARSGIEVPARRDEPILHRLRAAGVSVPTSCEAGVCGTCETTVLEGFVDHRDEFLTQEEKLSGETVLVCVSRCASRRLVLDL